MPNPAFPLPEIDDACRSRFENSIERLTECGCWIWTGTISNDGYGKIYVGNGRTTNAQRVAWRLHRGEIPKDLYVLHRCDVRSCVNPDHLFLGTHAENMADRCAKYWARKGMLPPVKARPVCEATQ